MQNLPKFQGQLRPLHEYAKIIRADWKKPYFGAKPYIQALGQLNEITDKYYLDDATSIVAYFLANASTWRGPIAKDIKAQLNNLLKRAREAGIH